MKGPSLPAPPPCLLVAPFDPMLLPAPARTWPPVAALLRVGRVHNPDQASLRYTGDWRPRCLSVPGPEVLQAPPVAMVPGELGERAAIGCNGGRPYAKS
eukprot:Skav210739  [mRNA]  locus=scaffold2652:180131:181178:- [translate_table: standard]